SNGFTSSDQRLVCELAGILLHVAAPNESDLGIEVRLDLVVLRRDQKFFISPACFKTPCLVSPRSARRSAAQHITIELEFLEELKVGVGPVNAVVIAGDSGVAAGHQSSDVRVSQEVPLDPSDEEIVRRRQAEVVRLHCDEAHVVAIDLSGHPGSTDDRNRCSRRAQTNTAAEERHQISAWPESEGARILQKEVPLLGEEQIESRQIHLLLIRFDLRKISPVCTIEGE